MTRINVVKYSQHPALLDALLKTGENRYGSLCPPALCFPVASTLCEQQGATMTL